LKLAAIRLQTTIMPIASFSCSAPLGESTDNDREAGQDHPLRQTLLYELSYS
jgi:hypothetical protein